MDVFGSGNKIIVNSNGNGFCTVKIEDEFFHVYCLEVGIARNYTNHIRVALAISKFIETVKKKVNITELKDYLTIEYGASRVS